MNKLILDSDAKQAIYAEVIALGRDPTDADAHRIALVYAATFIVGLAAQQAGRGDLIRSPTRVLAHTWEGLLE